MRSGRAEVRVRSPLLPCASRELPQRRMTRRGRCSCTITAGRSDCDDLCCRSAACRCSCWLCGSAASGHLWNAEELLPRPQALPRCPLIQKAGTADAAGVAPCWPHRSCMVAQQAAAAPGAVPIRIRCPCSSTRLSWHGCCWTWLAARQHCGSSDAPPSLVCPRTD